MHISPELRGALNYSIDEIIKDPKIYTGFVTEALQQQDIEPSLERIMSYLIGFAYGIIAGYYILSHDRGPNTEERNEITVLIKGRMHEMREALIETILSTWRD